MIIKPFLLLGLAAEYRSRRWVLSTVVRQPSEVYDTHRRTKLTALETISRSIDMVGAHQILMVHVTWSRSCQRWFAIRGLTLATANLPIELEVSNPTQYEDIKGDTKCRKRGGLGVIRITQGHWK